MCWGILIKMLGRTIGLGILSGTVATAYSFYENDFNIDSVGIVRFSRAATTVSLSFHLINVIINIWIAWSNYFV